MFYYRSIADQRVHFQNFDYDRFKTRSGDYYACETRIGFDMAMMNNSQQSKINLFLVNGSAFTTRIEFEFMRMQAFSDVNVSDFTGTGKSRVLSIILFL